ncbi:MAG: flagellar biosynthesis anti-sigma factor FlgM [Nitrospiraceae bacterium]|nr:flagellar biosynthesis anti-sigma factor FlgM [Nitrospiraceae bacterium]
MKVTGNRPPEKQDIASKIKNVGKQGQAGGRASVEKVGGADRVDLSGKAKEMADMKNTIDQLPDIRTDKVQSVSKAVNDGTYKIDSAKIANKMIDELV